MKKAVSVIISVILLFTACVAGCNKAGNDNDNNTNTNGVPRKITEDSIWYDTTRLEIDISDKGTQIGFEPICSDDENIYLYCDIYKEPVTKEEWEETNGGSRWGEVIKYSYKDQKIVWDKKVDNNSSVFRNKEDLVIMTSIQDPDT